MRVVSSDFFHPRAIRRVLSLGLLVALMVNVCGASASATGTHATGNHFEDPAGHNAAGHHVVPVEHSGHAPRWNQTATSAEHCQSHSCCLVAAKKEQRPTDPRPRERAIVGTHQPAIGSASSGHAVAAAGGPPGHSAADLASSAPLRL